MSLEQLHEAAVLHAEHKIPVAELARHYYREWGYASASTARSCVSRRLNKHGYPVARAGRPPSSHRRYAMRIDPRKPSAKMSREAVRAAHRLYMAGLTAAELGRLLHARYGYSSAVVCASSLRTAFRKDGLYIRPHAAVSRLNGVDRSVIVDLYLEGLGLHTIAKMHWQEWGYKSLDSCLSACKHVLQQAGIPRRSWALAMKIRTQRLAGTNPLLRGEIALTCPHGHPYDAQNTRWRSNGSKSCRECDRLRGLRRRGAG
jgi:hypothetical protein